MIRANIRPKNEQVVPKGFWCSNYKSQQTLAAAGIEFGGG
jgi:hypothetical protein